MNMNSKSKFEHQMTQIYSNVHDFFSLNVKNLLKFVSNTSKSAILTSTPVPNHARYLAKRGPIVVSGVRIPWRLRVLMKKYRNS